MTSAPKIRIKNIYVETNFELSSKTLYGKKSADLIISQVVIYSPSNRKGYYYGTSFPGFYISWRTGQIGLIAFDGRGQFCGTIDPELLGNLDLEYAEF